QGVTVDHELSLVSNLYFVVGVSYYVLCTSCFVLRTLCFPLTSAGISDPRISDLNVNFRFQRQFQIFKANFRSQRTNSDLNVVQISKLFKAQSSKLCRSQN